MTISYLITVCDEHVELERLLSKLILKEDDEIVILFDSNRITPDVLKVIADYKSNESRCISNAFDFKGDFSAYKNFGKSICTKEWIFQIDADEYLSDDLMENVSEIISSNSEDLELIYIPRINTVDGITEEHVRQWGWYVSSDDLIQNYKLFDTNSKHYEFLKLLNLVIHEVEYEGKMSVTYRQPIINFPDYQSRLFKNVDYINWEGKVHETLKGATVIARLPAEKVYCLLHPKDIERQERQNKLYNEL
jgi:hypothetical protein